MNEFDAYRRHCRFLNHFQLVSCGLRFHIFELGAHGKTRSRSLYDLRKELQGLLETTKRITTLCRVEP